jgi:hypothetical protein
MRDLTALVVFGLSTVEGHAPATAVEFRKTVSSPIGTSANAENVAPAGGCS